MKKWIIALIVIFVVMVIACNGNMKIEPVETKEVKKTAVKLIKKEELKEDTQKSLSKQAYLLIISAIFMEMGNVYVDIADAANNENIDGVGKQIEKLKKLNNELQEINEPKEFTIFEEKINLATENWENAYLELKKINPNIKILGNYIESANNLLDEAAKIMVKESE